MSKLQMETELQGYPSPPLLYPLLVLNISVRLLDEPPGCGPPGYRRKPTYEQIFMDVNLAVWKASFTILFLDYLMNRV